MQRASQAGSFEDSWRLFHDSFSDNEDEACESIANGVKNNFDIISRANLDETVTILRDLNRDKLADSLIDLAESKGTNEFWLPDDPFNRVTRDPRVQEIAVRKAEAARPVLNFEPDLVSAAESLIPDKMAQLAQVSEADYLALFESRSGEQLRRIILSALDYRRISNASDDMRAIVAKAESALRAIGKKSKLNELRIRKYGISLEEPAQEAGKS